MHICAYTRPQRSSSHTAGQYHLYVYCACRESPPLFTPETRPTRPSSSARDAHPDWPQAQGSGGPRRCVCPCPSSAPQDAANTEGSQGATAMSPRTSKGGWPFSAFDPFPDADANLLYGT